MTLLHSPDKTAPRLPLNADTFRPELSDVPSDFLARLVPLPVFDSLRARTTRIFQIGYNKCGTRSLYRFLQRSGIASAHFSRGLLAFAMRENIAAGFKPLAGKIDRYVAYTDVQQVTKEFAIEGAHFFRELYAYYPNSYFILNTRDKEGWIRSRLSHGAGSYVRRYCRALGLPDEEAMVARWSADWDRHHAEVTEFFADKPGRLLVFDIKRDDPQSIVDFLAPDFLTRVEDFRHEGDTAKVDGDSYRQNRAVRRNMAETMLGLPVSRKKKKRKKA